MPGERAAALVLALALALAALTLGACGEQPCVRHSDCDPGLVCSPTGACLAPLGPDGGGDDAADDTATDAAIDAAIDAGTDAPDGGPALDAPPPTDAAIDGVPTTLESEYAGPAIPEVGLPHALTTRSEAPR